MAIDKKLIDQLLTNYKKPEDIIGENGLLKELTKAILEQALNAEMTDHLGYEKHDPAGHHRGNTRNGKSQKTLKGDFGELELETPRDRQATFAPKIVAKGQTRWTGFDDKIISMYARGMTTREIQGHLEEMYGIDVSPALISNVTDAVVEEPRMASIALGQGRGTTPFPGTPSPKTKPGRLHKRIDTPVGDALGGSSPLSAIRNASNRALSRPSMSPL